MLKIKTEHLYSEFYHFRKLSEEPVNTACFKINFKDQNPINLASAYPITDEEGLKFEPYTFTITNTCESYASYQVNLEELITDLKRLPNEYIKIEIEREIKRLKELEKVNATIENADISYKIGGGVLGPNEVKSFSLRIWLDESTPVIDEVMNATFESKISITSTYQNTIVVPYLDQVKASYIPRKEDKYEFERYECNNEVELTWDNELWNYTLSNTKSGSSQNICKIYFKTITYEVVLYSEEATFEKNKVLTNLIKNGSFENDFDGWNGNGPKNGKISNDNCLSGKCYFVNDTVSSDSCWLFQSFVPQPKINDKVYQRGSINILNAGTGGMYFAISNDGVALNFLNFTTNTSDYKHVSLIYNVQNTNIQTQIGSNQINTSIGYFDDVYAINLTDIFGNGKEPSQEWVDKYIPYFDTTANIAVESIEKLETAKKSK